MNLSDVFSAVAYKQLVQVDLPGGSNQHEINGISALRDFFETQERVSGDIRWHYFADDQEPLHEVSSFTFYDARAKSAARTGRSEWRFYYTGDFLSYASVGDLLVLARSREDQVFGLIFQKDSAWLRSANVLFDFGQVQGQFQLVSDAALNTQTIELVRQRILDELEIEIVIPSQSSDESLITGKFGTTFPTTKEMSDFARTLVDVDPRNCDEALVRWITREEELFRALEKVVVSERIDAGFGSVEDFISFSLSVQNRRKSRMGHALENHLAALFTANRLRFDKQAVTEAKNKPDFLFPSAAEYHNPAFNAQLLVMLGSKSTCKDRWRQVLTEAARIPDKHLCTLEPAISKDQTDEMQRNRLTLVLPQTLHSTYTTEQQQVIMTVTEFVEFVRMRQTA